MYRSSMKLSCIMETLTWLPCLHLWKVTNDSMLCLVVYAIDTRWVVEKTLVIWPFLLMEVLCGLRFSLSECVIIWDRAGQVGESGEYRMGRVWVAYFHVQSSEGGSPHLYRLRTMLVGPAATGDDYVLAHTGFMGSQKLSSFDDRWVGQHPTVLNRCTLA
jgi:hypothetical protein